MLRTLTLALITVMLGCSPRNGLIPPDAADDDDSASDSCATLDNSWPAVSDGYLGYVGEEAVEGALAPNLSGLDQFGDVACLSQLLGAPIVLDFSTRWCGPCNEAASESVALLEEMRSAGPSWITTVMVQSASGTDATHADVTQWADLYGIDDHYPVLLDAGQVIADEYGVTSYPVFLFLAPDGTVVNRIEQKPSDAEILEFVSAWVEG